MHPTLSEAETACHRSSGSTTSLRASARCAPERWLPKPWPRWWPSLGWTIELHPDAAKSLRSLARKDRPMAKRITDYLADVERADDPRSRGKGLTGPLIGLWRYRIGDWRVVVDIYDDRLVILALDIEHRSRVYR